MYCTAVDVRLIIDTSLTDAEIAALIALADVEVDDNGIAGTERRKLVSMLLTARMIAMRDPRSMGVGEYAEARDSDGWTRLVGRYVGGFGRMVTDR